MKIILTAQLISVKESINKTTGETRAMLSFLDQENETPEVVNIKAPAGMPVSHFTNHLQKTYRCHLAQWNMNNRTGFFIRDTSDIQILDDKKVAA